MYELRSMQLKLDEHVSTLDGILAPYYFVLFCLSTFKKL